MEVSLSASCVLTLRHGAWCMIGVVGLKLDLRCIGAISMFMAKCLFDDRSGVELGASHPAAANASDENFVGSRQWSTYTAFCGVYESNKSSCYDNNGCNDYSTMESARERERDYVGCGMEIGENAKSLREALPPGVTEKTGSDCRGHGCQRWCPRAHESRTTY